MTQVNAAQLSVLYVTRVRDAGWVAVHRDDKFAVNSPMLKARHVSLFTRQAQIYTVRQDTPPHQVE